MKMINQFDELLARCSHHFKRPETFERARALAFSHLVTYGRHTISRLICGMNEQHKDWSADYKFFSKREWDADGLFFEILKACDDHSHWYQDAILTAMDETFRKKTGKKIPGVSTLRDPMSLRFHTNLMPAIRFLQASVIVNPGNRLENFRSIPIHLEEAAPAKKPKSNAPENVKEQYKKEQKEKRISVRGREAVLKIRQQVDKLPRGEERLFFTQWTGRSATVIFFAILLIVSFILSVPGRTSSFLGRQRPLLSTVKDAVGFMEKGFPLRRKSEKMILSPGRPNGFMPPANTMTFDSKPLRRFYGRKGLANNAVV